MLLNEQYSLPCVVNEKKYNLKEQMKKYVSLLTLNISGKREMQEIK